MELRGGNSPYNREAVRILKEVANPMKKLISLLFLLAVLLPAATTVFAQSSAPAKAPGSETQTNHKKKKHHKKKPKLPGVVGYLVSLGGLA